MDELSDDVIAFLSEGTRTAVLGWVAADGRALARDPRVVLCVDDSNPPYGFVQIQGVASISEDPGELLDIATRTGGRYMGADRAEEFGRRNGVPGELVVRVKPTKVHAAFDVAD